MSIKSTNSDNKIGIYSTHSETTQQDNFIRYRRHTIKKLNNKKLVTNQRINQKTKSFSKSKKCKQPIDKVRNYLKSLNKNNNNNRHKKISNSKNKELAEQKNKTYPTCRNNKD